MRFKVFGFMNNSASSLNLRFNKEKKKMQIEMEMSINRVCRMHYEH